MHHSMEERNLKSQTPMSFLEEAFGSILPLFAAKCYVTVLPDYTTAAVPADRGALIDELVRCLRDHPPDSDALRSPQGYDIKMTETYPLLKRYLRGITLRSGSRSNAWVQVLPDGGPF